MRSLTIGSLTLDNPIIIAPMAGISNSAFKKIMKEMGVGLITTEMVSDKALLHGNEKTINMIQIPEDEHPVALQLFGNEIESMVAAAKILDTESNCDIIDINMGCPAPKIVKNDSGSKILLDTDKVYNLAKAVKDVVSKPVTVKMRIGWNQDTINVLENARALERAGVDAIFVHGRTTKQMYTGKANWDIIAEVKKAVNIPVIGNGDIDSPTKAMDYYNKYDVDGIMIGRAALGNPWLMKECVHYFETGELLEEPTLKEKAQMCLNHLDNLIELKGEKVAAREMRGHAAWYLKGIKNSNRYRRAIQTFTTKAEFYDFFEDLMSQDQESNVNMNTHFEEKNE